MTNTQIHHPASTETPVYHGQYVGNMRKRELRAVCDELGIAADGDTPASAMLREIIDHHEREQRMRAKRGESSDDE